VRSSVAEEPAGADLVVARMGRAWRDLRRGAATAVVRDQMFGTDAEAIEPGHMDVLDLLDRTWRMGDLAAALRLDPSTITRTIQRMEADGLVVRTPATGDRRVVTVAITRAGRRIHSEVAQRRSTSWSRSSTRSTTTSASNSSTCSSSSSPPSTSTSATAPAELAAARWRRTGRG